MDLAVPLRAVGASHRNQEKTLRIVTQGRKLRIQCRIPGDGSFFDPRDGPPSFMFDLETKGADGFDDALPDGPVQAIWIGKFRFLREF